MSNSAPRRPGRPSNPGPREPNGRAQRPSKAVTLKLEKSTRLEVEQMVSLGEPQAVIAASLGCTIEQLTKRFGVELLHGHARRRREVVALMFAKARTGNSTLIKELNDLTRLAAAELVARDEPQREVRRGKKEVAQDAAESAGVGTEWGDDLNQSPALN